MLKIPEENLKGKKKCYDPSTLLAKNAGGRDPQFEYLYS